MANVEYRRTGAGGGWPATFTDVAHAADVLPALIARSRPGVVDLARTVYAGNSAGGQLALWAALRDRLPDGTPGRAAALPATGRRPGAGAGERPRGGPSPRQRRRRRRRAPGQWPAGVPDRYAAADPARLAAPHAPVVLLHGERDALVPLSMSEPYRDATASTLVELADVDHFALIDPSSAAWPAVLNALRTLARG